MFVDQVVTSQQQWQLMHEQDEKDLTKLQFIQYAQVKMQETIW
jgi:hypothetical protein